MSKYWLTKTCLLTLTCCLLCGGQESKSLAKQDKQRPVVRQVPVIAVSNVKPPEPKDQENQRTWVMHYGLTRTDFDRIKELATVATLVPMRIFPQEVRLQDKMVSARLVATTADCAKINKMLVMASGRFLVDQDTPKDEGKAQRLRVSIVLGAGVAKELFPFEEAVGKTVVINKEQYFVVGVIKSHKNQEGASNYFHQSPGDFDNDVYITHETCQVRFGDKVIIRQNGQRTAEQVELHEILVTLRDPGRVEKVATAIRDLLEKHHKTKDWKVTVLK